jgi:hypothetical protein
MCGHAPCRGCVLAREAASDGVRHLHVHSAARSTVIAMMARQLTGLTFSGPFTEIWSGGEAGWGRSSETRGSRSWSPIGCATTFLRDTRVSGALKSFSGTWALTRENVSRKRGRLMIRLSG